LAEEILNNNLTDGDVLVADFNKKENKIEVTVKKKESPAPKKK
jgi:hypothetical protein